MTELRIEKKFESLIPPLSNEEFEMLEKSILVEGVREPIVVWEGIIIDGHNRYKICKKHGILFNTVERGFEDEDEVEEYMLLNQLGRRNLTKETYSYLNGKLYEVRKKRIGSNQHTDPSLYQNDKPSPTHVQIAEETGVSQATVVRNAEYARAVDTIAAVNPELKNDILSGKIKTTKTDVVKLADLPKEKLATVAYELKEAVEKKSVEAVKERKDTDVVDVDTKTFIKHVVREEEEKKQNAIIEQKAAAFDAKEPNKRLFLHEENFSEYREAIGAKLAICEYDAGLIELYARNIYRLTTGVFALITNPADLEDAIREATTVRRASVKGIPLAAVYNATAPDGRQMNPEDCGTAPATQELVIDTNIKRVGIHIMKFNSGIKFVLLFGRDGSYQTQMFEGYSDLINALTPTGSTVLIPTGNNTNYAKASMLTKHVTHVFVNGDRQRAIELKAELGGI